LAIDNEYTLNRIMSFGGGYLIESVKEKWKNGIRFYSVSSGLI
jgi:hypothetical protein